MTRDRIVALARTGLPPRDIARELGKPATYVRDCLSAARRLGQDVPRFKASGLPLGQFAKVTVRMDVIEKLAADADYRGLTAHELAALILTTVAAEGLVDAVLDDQTAAAN